MTSAGAVSPPKWTWWPVPRRYLCAWLAFAGCVHVYVLRVNMSFAIVAMTTNRTDNNTVRERDFSWNSKDQGMILGSYFYGYITSQILGGFLAPIIGAARMMALSIFGTSLLTLLTPLAANYGGIIPLIAIRVIEGILQGIVYPTMIEFWSHWAPPLESSILLGIYYGGNHIGTFITMASCGLIAENLGWPWIFYIFGTTGIIWCVIWTWKVYEDPTLDPNITQEEKEYITSSIGHVHRVKFSEAPWGSILTSMPVWAAIIAHTAQNTGLYTMLTQLPTFLNDVSGWRLDKLGLLAAVPYLALAIVTPCAGIVADLLRGKLKMSTTLVRKIFTSGSYIIQMIFLLLTSQVTYSTTLVMVCLTLAVASGGFSLYSVNHLDLSQQYAGITLSVGNTFATLPGMISPVISGFIVQNKLASEWMIVFYCTSAVFLFGAIFYAIFASGDRQPWAKNKTSSDDEERPTEITIQSTAPETS